MVVMGLGPFGTSTEIKVKWRKRKRPEASMSEEDMLWKLFSIFGQIDHIELTGAKVRERHS